MLGGSGTERPVDISRRGRLILFLAVCSLGISAFVTQLTLMRELLNLFSGNELIFGIVLGNWLLLTGIGSALGQTASKLKAPLALLPIALILVAVLPIADVFLIRALRNVVFVRGAEVGLAETVLSCFVLLAPYCLIAGYLLTLACRILATGTGASSIGQVYFLDNIGDVIGGVLFCFVLIQLPKLDHFDILYVPAALNLSFACLVARLVRSRFLLPLAAAATAAMVMLAATCDLDGLSSRIQHAGQNVVYRGNSPYGSLVVAESSGQYNFIFSGVPLFSTQDFKDAEETVHYAMAQRSDARRVLLISGGVSGTVREILKYNVDAVDYVELDPLIIDVARRYLPGCLRDPRVHVINADGRLLVRQTPHRYDVVIADLPDPSTFQINRFYTREFFSEVARVLAPNGVLGLSLGHYENFLGAELRDLLAVADRTLKEVFQNVRILPGGRVFLLASDGPLTLEIAERIEQAGIETRWMRRGYLSAMLSADRLEEVGGAAAADAPVNKDFSPILYFYHLRLWMSQFRVRFGLLEGALLVLLVVFLVRLRPVPLAMFTTGFAASALEVVLLVGFQILCGSVYRQVALIVTMFMLGLGIGSFTMNRLLKRTTRADLARLEVAIAVYAACLPLVLIGMGQLGDTVSPVASHLIVPGLTLVLAVLVGLEFPLAGKVDFQAVTSTAARLYTADYVGAALGALLVSTLLIPLTGVVTVCLIAAAANFISGAIVLIGSKP